MTRRGAEFAVKFALELIKKIDEYERKNGKSPNMSALENALGTSFHVLIRYRRVLEELGLVEVVPEGPRNLVRLTDRGRCLARCLVS